MIYAFADAFTKGLFHQPVFTAVKTDYADFTARLEAERRNS